MASYSQVNYNKSSMINNDPDHQFKIWQYGLSKEVKVANEIHKYFTQGLGLLKISSMFILDH